VAIYPIWLCPFKLPAQPGMLRPSTNKEEMFVDIGVYGVPKANTPIHSSNTCFLQAERFDAEKTTRKIEEFVRSVNGFQMMYADSYMTRDEFRQMFDHTLYDR
jgi:delta24-sterol reductase